MDEREKEIRKRYDEWNRVAGKYSDPSIIKADKFVYDIPHLLTIIDRQREEVDELREAAEQILPKFEGWESMPDDKWLTVDRGDLRKLAEIIGRGK